MRLWGSCMNNDGIALTCAQRDEFCLNVNGSCLFAYIEDYIKATI